MKINATTLSKVAASIEKLAEDLNRSPYRPMSGDIVKFLARGTILDGVVVRYLLSRRSKRYAAEVIIAPIPAQSSYWSIKIPPYKPVSDQVWLSDEVFSPEEIKRAVDRQTEVDRNRQERTYSQKDRNREAFKKLVEIGIKVGDIVGIRSTQGVWTATVIDLHPGVGKVGIRGSGRGPRWINSYNLVSLNNESIRADHNLMAPAEE